MGVDGMNSADIFDEYFDDEKPKCIIKNCPAFDSKYNECHSKIEPHKLYCMDCTDCAMKQIIQECRKSIKCIESNEIACLVCNDAASAELAQDILQLLQIEEVE